MEDPNARSVDQPTPELSPPIGVGESPLWPQHLIDLFIHPAPAEGESSDAEITNGDPEQDFKERVHRLLVESSIGSCEETFKGCNREGAFEELGSYRGSGVRLKCVLESTPYVRRVFASETEVTLFEVHEIYALAEEEKVIKGFELIRTTLLVR